MRIQADMRLPESVEEVEVRACGEERIIAPVGRGWDSFFVEGPAVNEDFLSERSSQKQRERKAH